jgi:hypothetical protein
VVGVIFTIQQASEIGGARTTITTKPQKENNRFTHCKPTLVASVANWMNIPAESVEKFHTSRLTSDLAAAGSLCQKESVSLNPRPPGWMKGSRKKGKQNKKNDDKWCAYVCMYVCVV